MQDPPQGIRDTADVRCKLVSLPREIHGFFVAALRILPSEIIKANGVQISGNMEALVLSYS